MQPLLQRTITATKKFLARQYFVLFLMLAAGLKLCVFPRFIGFEVGVPYMWIGYLFSFLFSVLIFLPLLFVKKLKKPLALTVAFVMALVLFLDLIYFRFFQSLPTFGMMDAIRQATDIAPSALTLIGWMDLWLFLDVFLIVPFELAAYFLLKTAWQGRHKEEAVGSVEKIFLGALVFVLVSLFFAFTFLEKPRQKLSDALSWAFETRYNTQYFGVMGSHMIDGYRFFEEKIVMISPEEKQAVVSWTKQNIIPGTGVDSMTGVAQDKRVIMVQVESLGNFVIGKKYKGQEITPNLNRLLSSSYYFSDNRYLIGSGHTSDTDLVANSSLYPLYDSAAFVRYGKDNYTGLAKILAQGGYSTNAYHAYNRNFWNRSVALGSLGYQRFYAAESYPKGNTINMNGLADREFLSETARYIKGSPVKSLSFAITLSSHYPFGITNETKGLKLDPDRLPSFVGGYLQNINYTDRALGEFFEQLKKDGLYDDSIIVVYGDHAPTMSDFTEGELSFRQGSEENKKTPLFIKIPEQTTGQVSAKTSTTLDIMPTVLDLLGVRTSARMFGQSLFAEGTAVLPRCSGGEVIHAKTVEDCATQVSAEKVISAKIIKYNLFKDLLN